MSHHIETTSAYSIYDLGALIQISNLKLLLEEDRRLLVGRLDDARYEEGIWWRRRRMQKRKEVNWLGENLVSLNTEPYIETIDQPQGQVPWS